MSQSRKRLILKSPTPPSPYVRKEEVVLIGGRYDGYRVKVDPNEDHIQYGTDVYAKIFIEDGKGFKVTFYRSATITDIQAISMAISEYKKPQWTSD